MGNYAITPSGLTSDNYDIAFVDGELEITKKALTITAEDKTKVYGAADPAFTVTYDGFEFSDDVTDLGGILAFARALGENVGNYVITPSGLTSDNYDITFVAGELEITKKPLSDAQIVIVDPAEYIFDGNDYTPGDDKVTVSYPSGVGIPLTLNSGAVKDFKYIYGTAGNYTNAGLYTITIRALSADEGGTGNYSGINTFQYQILPRDVAEAAIAITAIPDPLEYTGASLQPEPAVSYNNGTTTVALLKGEDFNYSYADNVNGAMNFSPVAGKPTVTVNGTGNYTGNKSIQFVITDTQAPVFTQVDRGGNSLDLNVQDNWGLASVLITRGTSPVLDEKYTSVPPRGAGSYTASLLNPGTYNVTLVDLYGNQTVIDEPLRLADSDGDGLSDQYERSILTDPNKADTDGDGLTDGEEVTRYNTKPLIADTDGDGVNDGTEVASGLNPKDIDSDDDGILDGVEYQIRALFTGGGKSTSALELLLAPNRAGIQPLLTPQQMQDALNTLTASRFLFAMQPQGGSLPEVVGSARFRVLENGKQRTRNVAFDKLLLVKADASSGRVFGIQDGMLLSFRRNDRGRFELESAMDLTGMLNEAGLPGYMPTDEQIKNNVSPVVLSDSAGTLMLIGNWDAAAGKTVGNLMIFDVLNNKLFEIAESDSATWFDISPRGSKAVFMRGGKTHIIDLREGNRFDVDTPDATLLHLTADDDLVIGIQGGMATVLGNDGTRREYGFSGMYARAQKTNTFRDMVYIPGSGQEPIGFSFAGAPRLQNNGIALNSLQTKVGQEVPPPQMNSLRMFDQAGRRGKTFSSKTYKNFFE